MNLENLVVGGMFYGCGGGGSAETARVLFEQVRRAGRTPEMLRPEACPAAGCFITVYGVGSSAAPGGAGLPVELIQEHLLPLLPAPLCGIVPVEIGAKSLAWAFLAASRLGVPIVDADIVGGRASPEVFLEAITLQDIRRTPLLVFGPEGEVCLYLRSPDYVAEERFLRMFAATSGGSCTVAGYALTGRQVCSCLEAGTVTRCERAGRLIRSKRTNCVLAETRAHLVFAGAVADLVTQRSAGFLEQYAIIRDGADVCRVYIKNEALIAWVNGEVRATCPALLVMIDDRGRPLSSHELTPGLGVKLYTLPPGLVWRSPAARALFSPRQFGFDFDADG